MTEFDLIIVRTLLKYRAELSNLATGLEEVVEHLKQNREEEAYWEAKDLLTFARTFLKDNKIEDLTND